MRNTVVFWLYDYNKDDFHLLSALLAVMYLDWYKKEPGYHYGWLPNMALHALFLGVPDWWILMLRIILWQVSSLCIWLL